MPEAGMPEAGMPEAGMPEAGMPETGMPETGNAISVSDIRAQAPLPRSLPQPHARLSTQAPQRQTVGSRTTHTPLRSPRANTKANTEPQPHRRPHLEDMLHATPRAVKQTLASKESWWEMIRRWGSESTAWAWRTIKSIGPLGWLLIALVIAFAFIWYWQRKRTHKRKRVNVENRHDVRAAVSTLIGV